jgi:hypothetical protein
VPWPRSCKAFASLLNPIDPRNPQLILNGNGNLNFARHENGNKKTTRLVASTVSIRQALNC